MHHPCRQRRDGLKGEIGGIKESIREIANRLREDVDIMLEECKSFTSCPSLSNVSNKLALIYSSTADEKNQY